MSVVLKKIMIIKKVRRDITRCVFICLTAAVFGIIFLTPSTAQAAYRDTIGAEGTLLYYWPMDEAAGTTTLNAAVGGTAITLSGATAGASGQIDGTAVYFDGVNDYGVTASNINLTAYNKIAVEGLFYFNSYDNTDRLAYRFGSTYSTPGSFHLNPNSSSPSGTLFSWLYGSAMSSAAYTRPSAAAWHHIVAIYDMSTSTNEVDLYIDGALQSVLSRPANTDNVGHFGNLPLTLMSNIGVSYFNQGKIQHLAVYSNLSSDRILAHSQVALAAALSAGVLSEDSHAATSTTVSWTAAVGGVSPITAQLQRSPASAGTWSDVSGATTSPTTDSGVSSSTAYDYRVVYTDASSTAAYSNTVTITTDAAATTTTYTVQQADFWDNGYDNVAVPRQSSFSRFIFTTDAASVVVTGSTTMQAAYPTFAHLGVRVDGVDQSPLIFTANGSQSFTVNLGSSSTTRTVEIISGAQSKPSSAVIGTFINSVTYINSATFNIVSPVISNRKLFYGDSISVGGNATNPESAGYIPLLRNTYSHNIMLEGWGYRSLYEDTNTSGIRSAFVSRIVSYNPTIFWLAIGTNDYGLNRWSAANFGAAYAATLDDLHAALPSLKIVCQTPLLRNSETANTFGNTTSDYRSQIVNVCTARPWTFLIDGSAILTTSDLADGVHPSTSGHAKYALKNNDFLTITPTVSSVTASSVASSSAVFNGTINTIGSTTPNVRGFIYGLTTNYEIGTTTESGLFSTGSFSATISGLTPNSTYHYKSYTTNLAGTVYGSDQSFTTLALPTAAMATSSSGMPVAWTVAPAAPAGGFSVSVSPMAVAAETATLNFNAGTDVKKMAISFTEDFSQTSLEDYSPTVQLDICSRLGQNNCSTGEYAVYIKFYTAAGVASETISTTVKVSPDNSTVSGSSSVVSAQAVSGTISQSLSARLFGRILLQVESHGEAWYVNPENNRRYYLGRPSDAFSIMRELGLGATTKDIKSFTNITAPKRLSGRILLQVEDKGQAYYVNPLDLKLYYLGRPADAFALMRSQGLGITDSDLGRIRENGK